MTAKFSPSVAALAQYWQVLYLDGYRIELIEKG